MLRCSKLLSFSLVLSLTTLAEAAEDDPPPEAPPAEAPPAAPPPTAAPTQAPSPAPTPAPSAADPRVSPAATAPPGPAPVWGASTTTPEADRTSEPASTSEPGGPAIPRWQIAAGVRTSFIANEGFDPFSDDDRFFQFSLGGGRTLYEQDGFSIAASAFYDGATARSSARGEVTELEVHRISLGPELRAHVLPMLYAFVRPSPAAIRTIARLEESTTQTTLHARSWTFGFDAIAGAAFRAFSFGKHPGSGFWVIGEGGYGWASSSDLRMAPDAEDDAAPERVADVNLGTLAVRGPLFRVMIAATF